MWDYTRGGGPVGKSALSKDITKQLGITRSDWSQAEILANLSKATVRMAINGVEMLNYTDSDAKRWKKGPIGLQAHAGNKDVRYKDIFIEADPKEDKLITLKK